MKLAIVHRLKRNESLRYLRFTIIQLTNMLQALIDNRREIIQFAVLCNSNCPSSADPIAPCLEQALPDKLSKRKSIKEYMADSLLDIFFLWKDIARCPNVASTLPHDRTKQYSACQCGSKCDTFNLIVRQYAYLKAIFWYFFT
jgi:hypothetical protein